MHLARRSTAGLCYRGHAQANKRRMCASQQSLCHSEAFCGHEHVCRKRLFLISLPKRFMSLWWGQWLLGIKQPLLWLIIDQNCGKITRITTSCTTVHVRFVLRSKNSNMKTLRLGNIDAWHSNHYHFKITLQQLSGQAEINSCQDSGWRTNCIMSLTATTNPHKGLYFRYTGG